MDVEDIEEIGTRIEIGCEGLSKDDINNEILNRIGDLTEVKLKLSNYDHHDLESIILPNLIIEFDCSDNEITSFAGLALPNSLEIFDCGGNNIKSFVGLKLPNSLIEFNCSYNQIISYFIDDSLTNLILPNSLTKFWCFGNKISSIENFVFPPHLRYLMLDSETKFINQKFNSVLEVKLNNEVTYDHKLYTKDQLIFLYFNFNFDKYQQYDDILNLIK